MISEKTTITNSKKDVSIIELLAKENPIAASAFIIVTVVTFFFLIKTIRKFI